jgi:glycerophosphoryl diester phosphodiesterase
MRVAIIILLIVLNSCQKIKYYEDKELEVFAPQKIVHRGGESQFHLENTLDGIKRSLREFDGVEVDVQMSKDESIWLSHSVDVYQCKTKLNCFPEMKDSDIRAVLSCNGVDFSYTNLEDVFKFMKDSFPNKPICIDMKGWVPCSVNSVDIEGMLRREGELIVILAQKYGLAKNLLFETETTSVLDYLNSKKSGAGIYLTSYGDFERAVLIALKQKYSGISFKTNIGEKLSEDKIDLLHRKGLKIIVWNLLSSDEIAYYESIGVDYIQFDL